MREHIFRAGTAVALLVGSSFAMGQWTAAPLVHSPSSWFYGAYVRGVEGNQQVGDMSVLGGHYAILWTVGQPNPHILSPWTDMPATANAIADGQQVGTVAVDGGGTSATIWTGSRESWLYINPLGASRSEGHAVSEGRQAGSATFSGVMHAGYWSGTSESWVDLHLPGASASVAKGIHGIEQVGWVAHPSYGGACLWRGTPESFVDLNPSWANNSGASGVYAGAQVGHATATLGGPLHAVLWRGTAASCVDLHPSGAIDSLARAVFGHQQVGSAFIGGNNHAALWKGTAASFIDLQAVLPPQYTSSAAHGIWADANFTYVVGYAFDSSVSRDRPMMWKGPAPAPRPDLDPIGNKSVTELQTLTFTASATHIVPERSMTFALIGAPEGAIMDPESGEFSWTPTEPQGPDAHVFTVRVTDDADPPNSDEETITVNVLEDNQMPTLDAVPDQVAFEEVAFSYQLAAVDDDLPAQPLTFSLGLGAPSGMTVNPQTGLIQWTPTEFQGPGTFQVTAVVTDGNGGTDEKSFVVSVENVDKFIRGQIALSDFEGDYTGQPITFEIRLPGQSQAQVVRVANLTQDGTYVFGISEGAISAGLYDLTAKGAHWLRRLKGSVLISPSGANGVNFTGGHSLVNGDCDGDNEVGIGDYALLSSAYGAEPGSPHWMASADLNGDQAVDIGDYAILSANYGEVGD